MSRSARRGGARVHWSAAKAAEHARFAGIDIMRLMAGAAIFAFASLAATGGASATAFCNVKRTSDGYVALRATPSAKSRLVARMRVGDEIQAHSESSGKWIRATWWKGGRFKTKRDAGYDPPNGSGWVHGSLIENDCG